MSWVEKIGGTPKHLDADLVRPYSRELQAAEPLAAPYVAHFSGNDEKHLYYVAAKHGNGIDNDTCRTIANVVEENKPDFVIIEGIPSDAGVSPEYYQMHVRRQAEEDFVNVGEPAYAAHLAVQNDTPFKGGEPLDREMFEFMKTQGFSAKDMMAFYLVRVIPGWVENEGIDASTFDKKAQDYLEKGPFFSHVPESERLTVAEFKEWYERQNDKVGRPFLDLTTQDYAPYRSYDAGPFQKMSAALSDVREKHLVQQIDEALQENSCVLVVYGGGHLVKSRDVFENIFPEVGHVKIS